MKTGFKNELKDSEPKKMKNPWDFTAPAYDERTSCFINAGSEYGVGKKCPVGIEGNPKKGYAVPMGKVNTLKTEDVSYERLDVQ